MLLKVIGKVRKVADHAGPQWLGRSYAHFVLPVPFLDESDIRLLDDAVCAARRWTVIESVTDGPVLSHRWHTGRAQLVLVVLGWYPAIVTVGGGRGASFRVRGAVHRILSVVTSHGGRTVADSELGDCLHASRRRWTTVVATWRRCAESRQVLSERRCDRCDASSDFIAGHCQNCGRRFDPADDMRRDELARAAAETAARGKADLLALGCGQGLFTDWPTAQPLATTVRR
jgi:hypothetical protein